MGRLRRRAFGKAETQVLQERFLSDCPVSKRRGEFHAVYKAPGEQDSCFRAKTALIMSRVSASLLSEAKFLLRKKAFLMI